MNRENILLAIGSSVLILGLIYLVGGLQHTTDDQGRQLYAATLKYKAVRPLIGNPYAAEPTIESFRKQGMFSLYYPPMMKLFPIYPEYKIETTCENLRVDYDTQSIDLGFPQDAVLMEATLNNLPAGTSCKALISTWLANNKINEKSVTFNVPG